MTNRSRSRRDFNDRLPAGVGSKFRKELLSALDGHTFKDHYLRDELFSKYLDPKVVSPSQRQTNAIEKWLGCELTNMETNHRLIVNDEDFGWTTSESFLSEVRQLICSILGVDEFRHYSLFEQNSIGILQLAPFSNGASTRIKRSETAAIQKLTGVAHITKSALPYWDFLTEGSVLADQDLQIVDSSVMFTVDKKSDIDRVACKEPEVNMSLQRGVGEFIRTKLRKVGIDLRDQTVNQRLAKVAYAQGLATVDLSAASDSITSQLAFHCLPFSLWTICEDLRVKSTLLPNSTVPHDLEMFSSMGNGFTFELESLLFYAITRVVARRSGIKGRISVYGDDIICHHTIVPRLTRLFAWLGFRVNTKKTHSRGPFRESCGKHYFTGQDVTPFYVRREVLTVSDLILHLNHILSWDSRLSSGENIPFFTNEKLAQFHKRWSTFVPPFLWGGWDKDSNSSLITGHRSRKRIMPVKRKLPYAYQPAMVHWFMMAEHSTPTHLGDSTMMYVPRTEMCDLRPSWYTSPNGRSLEIDPKREVSLSIRYNKPPSWAEQFTWDPYLLFEDLQCGSHAVLA